jgi:SAM-dependent methyltransferase
MTPHTVDETVIWHDVECASYATDFEVWDSLAADPLLDVGCGTGRVALRLAAAGHDVTGFDSEPALINALSSRARERGVRVRTAVGDARSFDLGRTFAVVIAPMQVAQLMGGVGGRAQMLRSVRRHLEPGGLFAAALADPFEGVEDDPLPPLPDVREEEGWVFSSMPVRLILEDDATVIERLRQTVSPAGELTESAGVIRLDDVPPELLESEAEGLGFQVLPRRHIPETDRYVGSTVVMLEAV